MRFDPGNEIYEMLHNGTKYTRGTTNESAWPFRRLRCHSDIRDANHHRRHRCHPSHCLNSSHPKWVTHYRQTMRRVAPCASKRDTMLYCGNDVKGGTMRVEARSAKRPR